MTESEFQGPISPTSVTITPKRRRWRTFFLGVLILLLGIAIGGGTAVVVIKRVVLHAIHHPEEAPQRITERARRQLNLSDEQAAKVKEILTERQKKIQELRREIQPQVENEFQKAKEEVAAILTPDQAQKWRERFDHLRLWFPELPKDRSNSPGKFHD